jgi:hypothetical protein
VLGNSFSRRGVLRSFGPWSGNSTEQIASSTPTGSGEFEFLEVRKGRFGAYVKWGAWMASLPSDLEDVVDSLPAEVAWELIVKKMEQGSNEGSSKQSKVTKGKQKAKAKIPSGAGKKKDPAEKVKVGVKARGAAPAIPRRSAWLSFCSATRSTLAAEGIGASVGSASKALSAKWAALDAAGRAVFEAEAQALRTVDAAHEPAMESRLKASKAQRQPQRRVATSAYRVFAKDARAAACTAMGTNKVGPVAQELSRQWNALDCEARSVYERQAKEINSGSYE